MPSITTFFLGSVLALSLIAYRYGTHARYGKEPVIKGFSVGQIGDLTFDGGQDNLENYTYTLIYFYSLKHNVVIEAKLNMMSHRLVYIIDQRRLRIAKADCWTLMNELIHQEACWHTDALVMFKQYEPYGWFYQEDFDINSMFDFIKRAMDPVNIGEYGHIDGGFKVLPGLLFSILVIAILYLYNELLWI